MLTDTSEEHSASIFREEEKVSTEKYGMNIESGTRLGKLFFQVSIHIVTDFNNALPGNSCKHGPTYNSRGSCVFRVRGDVTTVECDHVTYVSVDPTDASIDWLDSNHVTCLL
jgi:hypothetical protein